MNPYTDARKEIVAKLVADGISAFGHTPPTIVPPLVTVTPGSEWITPNRTGNLDAKLDLVATAYVTLLDSAAAIDALEALVSRVLAVIPSGVSVTSVTAPRTDGTSSQGDLLASEISLTAQVKE